MNPFRDIWSANRKWRGLEVMTVGFLMAIVGAVVAFVGGFARDSTADSLMHGLAKAVMLLGWAILIVGALTMIGGILLNIWLALGGRRSDR